MATTKLRLDFQSDFLDQGLAVGVLIRPYAPGVVLGDTVFQRSDGLADRANASSGTTMPAIGIVEQIDFPNVGECIIRYDGDSTVIGGLTTGKTYIVGTSPGSLVAEDDTINPDYPGNPGNIQQQLGLASGPMLMFMRLSLFKLEINN